jgi:hypothetical protein
MSDITLLNDFSRVASQNLEYQRNRDRWAFLLDSYVGGQQYKNGGYLTKYQLETSGEYGQRLATTPLDNHCSSVVSVYSSFLFRESPSREFNGWEIYEDVKAFLKDANLEGQSLDAFMKDVATWNSVFGHCWILMTKANLGLESQGAEMDMGVRPYVNILTPLAVLDWTWERSPSGEYELVYFKYIEEILDKTTVVKEWTREEIRTWIMDEVGKRANLDTVEINGLGVIPAVLSYNKRSIVKGIGVSDIADIADIQRLIYNLTSEIEQSHRLDGHPSLVVTPDTQYGSGAGAVIVVPENSDPGLKPYVLEHGGANVASIHDTIQKQVEAINRISNTGGVRATETRTLSGVAMEVEFSLLNARLAEKADGLELTEEHLWKLFALYQGYTWDGVIEYPSSFNVRDTARDFQQLQQAKATATDPVLYRIIDEHLLELLGEEKSRLPYIDINPITGRTYPDGEAIPESLPPLYVSETDPQVPEGQNCSNCEYYKAGEGYCTKFDANVRSVYWCAKWEGHIED